MTLYPTPPLPNTTRDQGTHTLTKNIRLQGTYGIPYSQCKFHLETNHGEINPPLWSKYSQIYGFPILPTQKVGIHKLLYGTTYYGVQKRRHSNLPSLSPKNIHRPHPRHCRPKRQRPPTIGSPPQAFGPKN